MNVPPNIPYLGMPPQPIGVVIQGHNPMPPAHGLLTPEEADNVIKKTVKEGLLSAFADFKEQLKTELREVVIEELKKEKASNEKPDHLEPKTYKEFYEACCKFKLSTEELYRAHSNNLNEIQEKVQQLFAQLKEYHGEQLKEQMEKEFGIMAKATKVYEDLVEIEKNLINGNKTFLSDELAKVHSLYEELNEKLTSTQADQQEFQCDDSDDDDARYDSSCEDKSKQGLSNETFENFEEIEKGMFPDDSGKSGNEQHPPKLESRTIGSRAGVQVGNRRGRSVIEEDVSVDADVAKKPKPGKSGTSKTKVVVKKESARNRRK